MPSIATYKKWSPTLAASAVLVIQEQASSLSVVRVLRSLLEDVGLKLFIFNAARIVCVNNLEEGIYIFALD